MSQINFSKLYYTYLLMRDKIKENLEQTQQKYKTSKNQEDKIQIEILKNNLQLMNQVINKLYYCQEIKHND